MKLFIESLAAATVCGLLAAALGHEPILGPFCAALAWPVFAVILAIFRRR